MKNSKTFTLSIRPLISRSLLAFGLSVCLHSAQQTGPRTGPATAGGQPAAPISSTDQQRASIAAMADSISRQRESIQKQIGDTRVNGFFALPPPPHLFEPADHAACPPLSEQEVTSLVDHAANQEGVDPKLVRGVMQQESAFRPCAVSPKGAQGLMQLMPETASQLGVVNPFDPASNAEAGAKLLKTLLDRYNGNLMLALGAYNAGAGRVDAAGGVPNIPETINYINQILGALTDSNSITDKTRSGTRLAPLTFDH